MADADSSMSSATACAAAIPDAVAGADDDDEVTIVNYACLSICTYLYDDDSLILDSRSHITYPVDGQNSEVRLAYLRCLSTWEVSYVVVVAVVFFVVVVAVVVAAVGAGVGGAVVAVVVVVVVAHVFTMLVTSIFEGSFMFHRLILLQHR